MAREPEVIAELRRSLGAQLATFRLAAELTQGRLAKVVFCDRTTIVHIEKGRARADERFWRGVDAACHADGALVVAYLELAAAKAEYEQREREQRLAGVRARADELRGSRRMDGALRAETPSLDELRRAILGHEPSAGVGPAQVHNGVVEAHRLYQRADYDGAAHLLPSIISQLPGAAIPTHTKATAYLAAAKLATKLGDVGLAWIAADRSLRLANETDRPGLIGIANYQVACALLGNGHNTDAEATATQAAEHLESAKQEVISARGALLLLLALMAGRQGNRQSAKQHLRDAERLADQLGHGGNWLWTAFGPIKVAIHELAVHVALGDSRVALQLGESIDTDALSERVAEQAVSRNATARALLSTLLSRERKGATPGLRALAARAGVA